MAKEFEAINPKRRVPVLIMEKEVITEMSAVLTAIATVTPEAHNFGKTPLEKIRVYEPSFLSGLCLTLKPVNLDRLGKDYVQA